MAYHNKKILLASKHQKEQAIAPAFAEHLACELAVANLDTDQFGTFTGETERLLSPYETCVLKAKTAMNQENYYLAIASEGSFGPHPALPFVNCGHEIMVFVDLHHDWIIAEQLLTVNTNYHTLTIKQHDNIDSFLHKVKFPSHALTLQTSDKKVLAKGITDYKTLMSLIKQGFCQDDSLLLAADMRAMMNPTRMNSLGELANKLVKRIKVHCPSCQAPGFGFKTTQDYLPCSLCHQKTSLYRFEVWGCIQCPYEEAKSRQDKLIFADPTHCDYCNP
ncbi:DUF6671 family protein [Legionella sp. D16C41]|uniref:DUF6671 family protein n=1 Tax=Legionella sp. D16C41 TaxID=3402688 RepID=UPI003AF89098